MPDDWTVRTDSHCGFAADLAADDEAQLLAIVLDRWAHREIGGGAALVAVLSMALVGEYIVARSGPLAEGLLAAAGLPP